MRAVIKNEKDFYAGALFCALGTAFAIGATDHEVGTAANMGAGYFPLMLGVLLAVLGLVVSANALRGGTRNAVTVGPIAWKPLIVVVIANVVFGVCLGGIRVDNAQIIPPLGLIIGVFCLVVIGSMAEEKVQWPKVVVLACALAAISYLTFIVLLGLRIPVLPVL
jgi:hypothetical protein